MTPVTVRHLTIGSGIPGIIVPVMEETADAFLNSLEAAVRTAPDMLEIRLDSFENLNDGGAVIQLLKDVRRSAGDLPLLVTVRTAQEGGRADLCQADYETVIGRILDSCEADLIDLEYCRATPALCRAAAEKSVPVVMSFHDFGGVPSDEKLEETLAGMSEKGAAVLKIAAMAHSREDADRLMKAARRFSWQYEQPIIMIAMGKEGEVSRIAGERTGSCLTFASAGKASAPGQIEVRKMRTLLNGVHRIRQSDRLLYLTGFMGSGKSAAARELGRMTGQFVCDMDQMIEEAAGCTISEIFDREGEEGFRARETAVLEELSRDKGGIISCGGGVVLRPENRILMRRSGDVILLKASPETIIKRLESEADKRPLLRAPDRSERIRSLMEERRKCYEDAANLSIITDGLDAEETAREIILMVENEYEVG